MTKGRVFELRENLLKELFVGSFGLSIFWSDEQNQRFITSKLHYRCFKSDSILDGGIWTGSSVWELKVWISIYVKRKCTFRIFRLSRICCVDQNKWFVIWIVFREHKVFHEDLAWRNHTCSHWEKSVRKSRQINTNNDFFNLLNNWFMMEG